MLSDKILSFYQHLKIDAALPKGVVVMNPYKDTYTLEVCRRFYRKFYSDNAPRALMLGINPGRYGSGTTGVSFTDPIKLVTDCGIENSLPKKSELSADFMYRMISAYGGPALFYKKYFISSVSPLGFTREGKNINYYDDKELEKKVGPFAADSIGRMVAIGIDTRTCYCIGEGKNFNFLMKLNKHHGWFENIIPLPHPRFIMQYRRKQLDHFIRLYLKHLR